MNILGLNSNSGRAQLAREIAQIARRRKKKTPGVMLISRAKRYVEEGRYSEAIEELDRFELVAESLNPSERADIQSVRAELRRNGKSNLIRLAQDSLTKFVFSKIFLQLYYLIMSIPQIFEGVPRVDGYDDFSPANC